jgi:hypothetical protein
VKKITKKQMIKNVIDRCGVDDPNMGFIIETKDYRVLDNLEASKKELREAIAIEDWNHEENLVWGVFSNR